MKYVYAVFVILILSNFSFAQSDVDVTFYYYPDDNPSSVLLRGEFNGWSEANPMTFDATSSSWSSTIRLRVGGPPQPGVPGAYQYKFFADGIWLQDPLNPRSNPQDNNNSYLFIRNPTIHYLLPNSTAASGIIRTRFPEITAYIFPSTSSDVQI
jgi:hypothetical protein